MVGNGLRHGSLFSGIGGFDLAADWCGWQNIFHCEIDNFCNRVLEFYWPETTSIKNIISYDWKKWKGKIEVLSGGFPCQPYSLAGKRLGKEDERHLWPYMLKAVKELRPMWVVAENVLGLISWNDGLVFEEVHADLEAEGYAVQAYILPAAGVDAPHRRDRVWFVAYRGSERRDKKRRNRDGQNKETVIGPDFFSKPERPGEIGNASDTISEIRRAVAGSQGDIRIGSDAGNCDRQASKRVHGLGRDTTFLPGNAADASGFGCNDGSDNRQERQIPDDQRPAAENKPERQKRERWSGTTGTAPADTDHEGTHRGTASGDLKGEREKAFQFTGRHHQLDHWKMFPTQSPVCGRDDGFPGDMDFAALFDGIPFPSKPITFSKWRTGSIKSLGNAIVPEVAYQIFAAISKFMIKTAGPDHEN
jgi:DNA (cytosine-5)-methyltransferase 1